MAIDYRGYGDSSHISQITETSMVEDSTSALKWLLKNCHPKAKIIVWGYSLGTGVASKLASTVRMNKRRPKGYVLEAPFDRMESITSHWIENGPGLFGWTMGTFGNIISKFFITIGKILEKRDLKFDNEKCLLDVKEKVIILHAEDDAIVPFKLGKKLYQSSLTTSENRQLFAFEKEHKLGHHEIYKYHNLSDVMKCVSNL